MEGDWDRIGRHPKSMTRYLEISMHAHRSITCTTVQFCECKQLQIRTSRQTLLRLFTMQLQLSLNNCNERAGSASTTLPMNRRVPSLDGAKQACETGNATQGFKCGSHVVEFKAFSEDRIGSKGPEPSRQKRPRHRIIAEQVAQAASASRRET